MELRYGTPKNLGGRCFAARPGLPLGAVEKTHSYASARWRFYLLALLAILTSEVASQAGPRTQPDTSRETIFVDNAETLRLVRRAGREIQQLAGTVELSQDSIFMYCDSAELVEEVQVYAFDNVIIQQGDSIAAFSEYLDYNAETELANLRQNVVLQNGRRELHTEALNYNLATKLATYRTGGRLTDGETQLFSTRGYYYADAQRMFFRDSVVVIGAEFELRADTLLYDAAAETVYFLGPTVIRTDSAEIYCESGFYRVPDQQAVFRQNAQYRGNERIATADSIVYFGQRSEYILDGRAYIREGDHSMARAERIIYRKARETYQLEGKALLRDSLRTVRGEYVEYDLKRSTYRVAGGRSRVTDGPNIIVADSIDYDQSGGFGRARGGVVWQDTSAQMEIRAARADYNNESGYLKASGGRGNRALLITVLDGDSLYLSADTLYSREFERDSSSAETISIPEDTLGTDALGIIHDTLGVLLDPMTGDSVLTRNSDVPPVESQQKATNLRTISAYRDVRIFKSDMQALCDSLSFNTTDSILTLYEDPIMWQDTSQLLADTIDVYLRNDALDKVHLKRKALVVTSPDLVFFNQVKGKDIFAYFDSTQLRRTDVRGNAEVIYYAQDEEGGYIGVNKTACSVISMDFRNGGIDFIRFLVGPSGRLDPMGGLNPARQPRLDGFRWAVDTRPQGLADLFGPRPGTVADPPDELPGEEPPTPE